MRWQRRGTATATRSVLLWSERARADRLRKGFIGCSKASEKRSVRQGESEVGCTSGENESSLRARLLESCAAPGGPVLLHSELEQRCSSAHPSQRVVPTSLQHLARSSAASPSSLSPSPPPALHGPHSASSTAPRSTRRARPTAKHDAPRLSSPRRCRVGSPAPPRPRRDQPLQARGRIYRVLRSFAAPQQEACVPSLAAAEEGTRLGCSTSSLACVLTPLCLPCCADDYTATNPDGGAVSLNFCGPVSSDESPAEGEPRLSSALSGTASGRATSADEHAPRRSCAELWRLHRGFARRYLARVRPRTPRSSCAACSSSGGSVSSCAELTPSTLSSLQRVVQQALAAQRPALGHVQERRRLPQLERPPLEPHLPPVRQLVDVRQQGHPHRLARRLRLLVRPRLLSSSLTADAEPPRLSHRTALP